MISSSSKTSCIVWSLNSLFPCSQESSRRILIGILVAREEFDRFKAENPEALTNIQRAVRFYYFLRCGYAARIKNPSLNINTSKAPNMNLLCIEADLSAAHLRLSRVYIENRNHSDLIRWFDRPYTFFYADSPYFGFEDYHGDGIFSSDDYGTFSQMLKENLSCIGWGTRIRTLIHGVRVRCPAIERPPSTFGSSLTAMFLCTMVRSVAYLMIVGCTIVISVFSVNKISP